MYEGYEDDPEFKRPNHLALISVITGSLTLAGQVLVLCMWYCGPFLLALPTLVTLLTGWLGYQQSKITGQGRDASVVGLILGFINLLISLGWILLIFAYVLLVVVMIALESL